MAGEDSKSKNPVVKPPVNLADLLSDPKRVEDAFALLNALLNPTISMATPAQSGGRSKLVVTRSSAQFVLALKYPGGVPTELSPSATLADVILALNSVLRGEKGIQNPPGQ